MDILGVTHPLARREGLLTIYALNQNGLDKIFSHLNSEELSLIAESSRVMLRTVHDVSQRLSTRYREDDAWLKSEAFDRNRFQDRFATHRDQVQTVFPANVMKTIIRHLDLKSLWQIAATCNEYHEEVAEQHYVLVCGILSRFTDLPRLLLRTLDRCHAVISGPIALEAVLPHSILPCTTLDIYVPSNGERNLRNILIHQFGFEEETTVGPWLSGDHPMPSRALVTVVHLRKSYQQIKLFVVTHNPLTLVFGFKSTIAMNFISSHGIFCAYPRLTLNHKGIVNHVSPVPKSTIDRCRFYDDLGFRHGPPHPLFLGQHECGLSPICPQTTRHLYDLGSMFLEFPKPRVMGWKSGVRYTTRSSNTWLLHCGATCGRSGPVEKGFSNGLALSNM